MKIKLIQFKSVKSTNNTAPLIKKNIYKPTMVVSKNKQKEKELWEKNGFVSGNLFISIFFEIERKINFKQFAILNAFIMRK